MTIGAWRITKKKHAATAFTGVGAKENGGRWNNPGTAVVYCAGSTSLAILEMLVHLESHDLLGSYVTFEVAFDESLVERVDVKSLPRSWRRSPAPGPLQRLGDEWVAGGRSAVLRLPSAIVPTEWNYLLNPAHPDFSKISVGPKRPIQFDARLTGGQRTRPSKP